MAFCGDSFIFDSVPSEKYGLLLYEVQDHKQDSGVLGSKLKISEDRILRRASALHYGVTYSGPLEFKLVFGVYEDFAHLDRFDLSAVAAWLTGHQQYKWLTICQPDMESVRYKCIITELKQIEIALSPIAFEATVTCDSPYAYHLPEKRVIACSGTTTFQYRNPSNVNGYYFPSFKIDIPVGTQHISISNSADAGRSFQLSNLSLTSPLSVFVNGETMAIEAGEVNLYESCNFEFLRLVRGINSITNTGNCTITMLCEVPMNVGF